MGQTGMGLPSTDLQADISYLAKKGIKISPEEAAKAASMISEAAESMKRCESCRRTGLETTDCVATKIAYDVRLKGWYGEKGPCIKAHAYLQSQKLARLFRNAGMGNRFLNRSFETFDVFAENKDAYEVCRAFCDNYTPNQQGIMMIGSYGSGKTHLAAAIIHEMIEKHNVGGVLVTVPDLLAAIRRSYGNREEADLQHLFDTVKKSPLLVLDDLGAENANAWVREELFKLLNARYEYELPTIFTTNFSMSELADKEKIGPRIMSRVIEMTTIVNVRAADYRMMGAIAQ